MYPDSVQSVPQFLTRFPRSPAVQGNQGVCTNFLLLGINTHHRMLELGAVLLFVGEQGVTDPLFFVFFFPKKKID